MQIYQFTKPQFDRMSSSDDGQVAFDNWQDAAEQLEKQEQIKQENKDAEETVPQVSDEVNQQQNSEKKVIKHVDPKDALKDKIQEYAKMTPDYFAATHHGITEENKITAKNIGNPVLKSDKDFMNYAKQLAKKFDNMVEDEKATIDDEKMAGFFEDITLYMYKNLEWKNIANVQTKLKVVKKQRKDQQAKRAKQQIREKIQKKAKGQESQTRSKSKTAEDDLFGGAALVTSKDEEQERKNKILEEVKPVVQSKQEIVEDDDDDFM